MNIVKVLLSLILFSSQAFGLNTSGVATKSNKTIGQDSKENALLNGDFEDNTYGAILVNAGATFIAKDLNSGIFGHALKVTSPSNTAEIKFGIDTNKIQKLNGLNCEAKFNLKLFSSNLTPTVVNVDVVQGTSTVLSNVQSISLGTSGIWVPMSVNFPCGSVQSASYARITITSAGTVASGSVSFIVDSLYVGEATNITNQVVVTDWQDYTPTFAGLGTVSSVFMQYRRVGGNLEIAGRFASGTPTATTASIGLPSNLSMTTSSVVRIAQGEMVRSAGSSLYAKNYSLLIPTSGGSSLQVGVKEANDNSDPLTSQVGTSISGGAGQTFNVTASVPIVGWSATQSAITQQCIQDGSCENTFSAEISATGVVTGENIDWIAGNCNDTGLSQRICTLKTGMFSDAIRCVGTLKTDTNGGTVRVYNESSTSFYIRTVIDNVSNAANAINIVCRRGPNDYKPRFAAPVLTGSVTSNSQSALRIESVAVTSDCTSSPCTIARQSSAWVSSIARTGTGEYTINFVSGVFSSTPDCYCSSISVGITATNCAKNLLESTSSVRFLTTTMAGANTNSTFSVSCIGPR